MKLLLRAVGIVRTSWSSFLLMNLVYFGLVGAGMAFGAWNPAVHERVIGATRDEINKSEYSVVSAYRDGHFASAFAWTVSINLLAGAFLVITLPSMVIPFGGMVVAGIRAVLWGLIFTPSFMGLAAAGFATGLLIAGLILLEGSGYVLPMLGSYLHGVAWLRPATVGAETHRAGYWIGAGQSLGLYPLVAGVLAVAALYEATIVIWLIPMLK